MSYEPFALKYRPRTFHDVVGQSSVAETLQNALRQDRLANAFLFCGSRGVGKTSMARILSRALNCENADPKTREPCGSCEVCIAIGRGEDLDVIEIDGASNRGIDEIRTIRDQAAYAPARGRFKIYIIDEVHMLTVQAFNALLKTLEEPPPHVKFIFATTELRAVPDTIVSRCQRFEFRRISIADIIDRLRYIAGKEGLTPGAGVLEEIARQAEGGLRDSLGLFDQLIAFAGEAPELSDLERVLGRLNVDLLAGILLPVAAGDAGAALDGLDEAFDAGRDADEILEQSTEILRQVMRIKAREGSIPGEDPFGLLVAELLKDLDLDRVLLAQRLLLNARRESKIVGEGRLQLELAMLRIARSRDLVPIQSLIERLQGDDPGEPPTRRPRLPTDPAGGPTASPAGGGDPGDQPWRPRPRPSFGSEQRGSGPRGESAPAVEEAPPKVFLRSERPKKAVAAPIPSDLEQSKAPVEIPLPSEPSARPDDSSPPVATAAALSPVAAPSGVPEAAVAVSRRDGPSTEIAPPLEDLGADVAIARKAFARARAELRAKKPRLAAALERAELVQAAGGQWDIELPGDQEFHLAQLEGPQRALLERAYGDAYGQPVRVRYRLSATVAAGERSITRRIQDDPFVRKVLETFGGSIVAVDAKEP